MSSGIDEGRPVAGEPSAPAGQYWAFFWPLTLTGLAMVLARQCQNGALGRFDDGTRKLAVFAYAWSTFHLFNSPMIFIPQMVNALGRSRRARRKCLTFSLTAAALLTAPVLVLAFSPAGRFLLPRVFPLDADAVDSVVLYLRYLSPMIVIHSLRQHFIGLLIQSRRTGLVTIIQVFSLAAIMGLLVMGLQAGWPAVATLATAQVVSAAATMVVAVVLYRRFRRPPLTGETAPLTLGRILAFFWPVAMTSVMFSMTRPILYSFAGRVADGVAVVAALRVALDLAMVVQGCLNQFRNLFVTFGRGDLAGIRRFLFRVWFVLTAIMLSIALTPVSTWIFSDLLGVEPHVATMARQALTVLCLAPLTVSVRNYFHGLAMTGRSTLGMAAGGVCRVATIYVGSVVLFGQGWLNPATAAGILVAGFGVEAVIVVATLLIQRRRRAPGNRLDLIED